eukprot:scaffold59882_cov39-Prasinocladus_malaysianus.AAC.2
MWPLQPGDPVAFRITTNLRAMRDAISLGDAALVARRAQRATQVTVIRHAGTVAALRPQFGFIEYATPPINAQASFASPRLITAKIQSMLGLSGVKQG